MILGQKEVTVIAILLVITLFASLYKSSNQVIFSSTTYELAGPVISTPINEFRINTELKPVKGAGCKMTSTYYTDQKYLPWIRIQNPLTE